MKRLSSTYESWVKWASSSGQPSEPNAGKDGTEETLEKVESTFWNYGKSNVAPSGTNQFADKLMEMMILVVIPTDVGEQSSKIIQERIATQKNRPMLLMNAMSSNLINLNLRLSWPFYTIDQIIAYFNWDSITFTIGVLLCVTHVILDPVLISIVPLVMLLQSTLVPHYMGIYAPEKSLVNRGILDTNPVPWEEQVNKYHTPKPVPQFSREFVLNLTDLQNHQVLYIVAYDFFIWLTNDYLYFKDERVSLILLVMVVALIFCNLLVGRYVLDFLWKHTTMVKVPMIVSVWAFTVICHPDIRSRLLEWVCSEETRLHFQNMVNRVEGKLVKLLEQKRQDEVLQEVEIYELQKLDKKSRFWRHVGYTPDFHTFRVKCEDNEDLSLEEFARIDKIIKKKTLESIKPPADWVFVGSRWVVDLYARQWVERNLITDLVIVDEDEKWVYDYVHENEPKDVYRRRRWVRNVRRERETDRG